MFTLISLLITLIVLLAIILLNYIFNKDSEDDDSGNTNSVGSKDDMSDTSLND